MNRSFLLCILSAESIIKEKHSEHFKIVDLSSTHGMKSCRSGHFWLSSVVFLCRPNKIHPTSMFPCNMSQMGKDFFCGIVWSDEEFVYYLWHTRSTVRESFTPIENRSRTVGIQTLWTKTFEMFKIAALIENSNHLKWNDIFSWILYESFKFYCCIFLKFSINKPRIC